jgi:hypothetical protein
MSNIFDGIIETIFEQEIAKRKQSDTVLEGKSFLVKSDTIAGGDLLVTTFADTEVLEEEMEMSIDELVDNICECGSSLWTGETSDSDGRWIPYPDPEAIKEAIQRFAKAYAAQKVKEEREKFSKALCECSEVGEILEAVGLEIRPKGE